MDLARMRPSSEKEQRDVSARRAGARPCSKQGAPRLLGYAAGLVRHTLAP